MKRLILLIIGYILIHVGLTAQTQDVNTIIQTSHYITHYDICPNERYVYTTDGASIALWDLRKQRMITRLPIGCNDIRAHSYNPRWVYVLLKSGFRKDTYVLIDIFTGKKVSFRNKKDMPLPTYSTSTISSQLEGGVVFLFSRKSKSYFGLLDGAASPLIGSIDINRNDSLLLVTGYETKVWDLKQLSLASNIPYYQHLKEKVLDNETLVFRDNRVPPVTKKRAENDDYYYGWHSWFSGYFSPSNDILLGGYSADITRWNLQGKMIASIPTQSQVIFSFSVDSVTSKVVAATYDGIEVGDMKIGLKNNTSYNKRSGDMKPVYLVSPLFGNGNFIAGHDNTNVIMGNLYNLNFRKRIYYNELSPANDLSLSSDYRFVLGAFRNELKEIQIEHPENNREYDTYDVFKSEAASCASYLSDSIIAAASPTSGIVGFWHRGQAKAFKGSNEHNAIIQSIKKDHQGNHFYTGDTEGNVMIWNLQTLKPILTIHPLGNEDYVYRTPDNYYTGSHGLSRYLHFSKGMEVYSFDQFDLSLNRPDIIAERMGLSHGKVDLFHKAWLRRIHKMGYTPEMITQELHAPDMELTNWRDIPEVTEKESITLQLKAQDSKYLLSKIYVRLNGVPVDGIGGLNISQKKTQCFNTSYNLDLMADDNLIEVSCMNEKGVESYRQSFHVLFKGKPQTPNIYIASIGVSHYKDETFNLNYAAKDATDFSEMLTEHAGNSFSKVHQLTLCDKEVSFGSLQRIREFFAQAQRNDIVILFYAGHGLLDKNLDYYLGTYDVDFSNPGLRGWKYDELESCLDGLKAIRKLCFIDACHSGELDKEDYLAVHTEKVGKESLKFRSVGTDFYTKKIGLEEIRSLTKEMFLDIRNGVGASILSSSDGVEVSIEGDKWNNGLFTWAIKKGIIERLADANKDGQITLSELSSYVGKEVNTLSSGLQSPGMRLENHQQDFVLCKYQ